MASSAAAAARAIAPVRYSLRWSTATAMYTGAAACAIADSAASATTRISVQRMSLM